MCSTLNALSTVDSRKAAELAADREKLKSQASEEFLTCTWGYAAKKVSALAHHCQHIALPSARNAFFGPLANLSLVNTSFDFDAGVFSHSQILAHIESEAEKRRNVIDFSRFLDCRGGP